MTPGEEAEQRRRARELADADYQWDGAYAFSWQPGPGGWGGKLIAVRADNGGVVSAPEMARLRGLVREDYAAQPVKRADSGYAALSHEDPDDLQRDGIDPR